jgi:hypothetical protein
MARDSLFGEAILWTGTPTRPRTPAAFRIAAIVAAIVSATTLAFAVVIARGLGAPIGGMLAFSLWCALLAASSWRLPIVWLSRVEYIITEKHVIWRRGRLRRTIDRSSISFAHVRWDPSDASLGDLVLVRAVPTGALRRTLRLTLSSVQAPDRVWAMVRGIEPSAALGDGNRPLGQRLDPGERVVWTARPLSSPWTVRRVVTGLLAAVLVVAAFEATWGAVGPTRKVIGLHTLGPWITSLFVAGISLGVLLLVAVAGVFVYGALLRPLLLKRSTRYFVTNRRVLIQRGTEELLLDRSHIAYVIAAPTSKSLQDVFLVLDGPQARALAASGAFGRKADGLEPVLASIDDAATVGAILAHSSAHKRAA